MSERAGDSDIMQFECNGISFGGADPYGQVTVGPLQFEDFSMRPDDLYRKRHLRAKVEEAVKQLPEHHRIVFVLREMEGKTYDEIADITGCKLGTVKSRLNRARNNFAQIIAPMID